MFHNVYRRITNANDDDDDSVNMNIVSTKRDSAACATCVYKALPQHAM